MEILHIIITFLFLFFEVLTLLRKILQNIEVGIQIAFLSLFVAVCSLMYAVHSSKQNQIFLVKQQQDYKQFHIDMQKKDILYKMFQISVSRFHNEMLMLAPVIEKENKRQKGEVTKTFEKLTIDLNETIVLIKKTLSQ